MKIAKWIYQKRPSQNVSPENYQLVHEEGTPEVFRGEVLIEGKYWSVDPYMRIQQSAKNTWEAPHPVGEVQGGAVIGQVIAVGDNTAGTLSVGDWVETYMGWRTHGVRHISECRKLDLSLGPPSTGLHVLGMPGRIAYFGLLEAGEPKPGETLVVSGAAGAVGSIVGQIAKLGGCKVIGIVGSEEKRRWVTEELGFDAAILYKNHNSMDAMLVELRRVCPQGVDVYFDNVGGYITDAVLLSINLRARIVICGQISQYQGGLDTYASGPRLFHQFLYKRAYDGSIGKRLHRTFPGNARSDDPMGTKGFYQIQRNGYRRV